MTKKSVNRIDAASKADGSLKYTDDLEFNGLYGEIVRSSIAYGKILSITYAQEFDFSDFTIVDYRDIEGKNINPLLTDDQAFLAQRAPNSSPRVKKLNPIYTTLSLSFKFSDNFSLGETSTFIAKTKDAAKKE